VARDEYRAYRCLTRSRVRREGESGYVVKFSGSR
jgi:hypothetical protein